MGPGAVLQAEAEQEMERAARQLARPGEERHQGIHQARKSIRRVRALLALGGPRFSAVPAVKRLMRRCAACAAGFPRSGTRMPCAMPCSTSRATR